MSKTIKQQTRTIVFFYMIISVIENCRGLIPRTLVRQFSIPKTARSNTPTFRLGISAVFVIFTVIISFFNKVKSVKNTASKEATK